MQLFSPICDFAKIAKPLSDLTRKDAEFRWTPKEHLAFTTLKDALTKAPILAHFDNDAPTELRTDACGYGIGGVCVQYQKEGPRPLAYYSRKLNAAERNYPTHQQECLAVVE